MKKILVFALTFLFVASVMAVAPVQATPQQERMKACNAEAKTKALKGDERKQFMSDCLKEKKTEATTAQQTQQEKMKACNADAKTKALKGDERNKFMSDCLKK